MWFHSTGSECTELATGMRGRRSNVYSDDVLDMNDRNPIFKLSITESYKYLL